MYGVSQKHSTLLAMGLRIMDPLLAVTTALAAEAAFTGGVGSGPLKALAVPGGLLTFLVFSQFNMYRPWNGYCAAEEARALILAWLTNVVAMAVLLQGLGIISFMSLTEAASWRPLAGFWAWAVATPALLIGARLSLRSVLKTAWDSDKDVRRAVIIGANTVGKTLASIMLSDKSLGYRVLSFLDNEIPQGETVGAIPVAGPMENVAEVVNSGNIQDVFVARPVHNDPQMISVLESLGDTTADVYLVPDVFSLHLLRPCTTDIGGVPMVNLNGSPCNIESNRLVKWLEDKVLSLLILILISPLLLAIAVAIKATSPGPVIFRQTRHGVGGDLITVYKFRTMSVTEDGDKVVQAKREDPRVTRLGAFLRKTSLDELPQFVNVLRGDMSIVGPRPHAVYHTELYRKQIQVYMHRLKVKPGITGWAQVNGYRGQTEILEKMKKRVEYDLFYITNWSLWFDMRIILLTPFKGLVSRNAY